MDAIAPIEKIQNYYKSTPVKIDQTDPVPNEDFGSIFKAAVNMLEETNTLEHKAENEEIKFILGEADNAHDVMIAARKASIALQYTNTIRQSVVQGYQTIMQMQI